MAQETVIEIKHVATENSQKSAGKAEKGALDGDDVFEHSSPIITDGRNAALDNSETFKLVPPSSGALDDHTDIARQRIVIDDVLVDSESAFSRGRSSAAPSRMLQSKASVGRNSSTRIRDEQLWSAPGHYLLCLCHTQVASVHSRCPDPL